MAIGDILLKKEGLVEFNKRYRQGPELYFYKKIININLFSKFLEDFLDNNYHMELLYATLVSWDMNSRGAKMLYFDEFRDSIISQKNLLKLLWKRQITAITDIEQILKILGEIYDNLHLMRTRGKLVSNSKVLHYIFPELLMPIDRQNTLMYFYNSTSESKEKYIAIIRGSFELIRNIGENIEYYLDNKWNRTIPKTIDNAIIIKMGKSVR